MSVETNVAKAPTCVQHEPPVVMVLRTIHTDAALSEDVIGQYECPECGFEKREPMKWESA